MKHIHRIPPQQQEDESYWLAKFTSQTDSGFCVPAKASLHCAWLPLLVCMYLRWSTKLKLSGLWLESSAITLKNMV
ncbi:hypothetical protein [Yersinia aldovae]|uniref:hypothetical protein n=1 Tax=Yersinia aldovae TaxID=29483 RepID=UPI0012E0158F|nr:hypothetical protein [Yersinia aldovae]